MSTLGGMLNRARSKTIMGIKVRSRFEFKRRSSNWLPRDEWETKLRREGKWKEYK